MGCTGRCIHVQYACAIFAARGGDLESTTRGNSFQPPLLVLWSTYFGEGLLQRSWSLEDVKYISKVWKVSSRLDV